MHYLLASVNFGLPSPITQAWELSDYPEKPYIVLHEYKVGDDMHEIRLFVSAAQIQNDPLGQTGRYFCRGLLESSLAQDIEL